MITQPKLEDRKAQPYVEIRSQIPMHTLPMVIPQCNGSHSSRGASQAYFQSLAPKYGDLFKQGIAHIQHR